MTVSSPPAPPSLLRRVLGHAGGRLPLAAAVMAGVVALDAGTKVLATRYLSGREPVELLGGFITLDFLRNFAGPNDILPGHTVLISIFAIIAVLVLLVVAYRVTSTLGAVTIGLLLGGAIGNLLDRLLRQPGPLRGGVVDWLRLAHRTNSMNLADLALDLAIAALLVGAVVGWWRGREAEGEAADAKRDSARL